MKSATIIVVFVSLLSVPSSAKATPNFDGMGEGLMGAFVGVLANVVGLAPAVANTVYVAKGRQSPGAWLFAGYLLAASNAGVGAWQLSLSSDRHGSTFTDLAIVSFSVATVNLGLAIWANVLPKRRSRNLVFVPLVGVDSAGGVLTGAGVQFQM